MAQGLIKWKKGDYIRLGKAVAQFNKKINALQAEERRLYLPELVNYKEKRDNITTRAELNRLINSLKRFKLEGAEELYETEAGEQITKWERRELGLQSRIAQNRLQKELKQLNTPDESGYSRVQMGSIRAREIEAQLRNLKKIESRTGYDFNALRRRIFNVGTNDYEMRRAIQYRKNYFSMIKNYENFDNYDKLYKKLNSIKNPIEFYNYVTQNELLSDIIFMYDNLANYGLGLSNDQMNFDYMLESIGIEL